MRLVWLLCLSACVSLSHAQENKLDQRPRIILAVPLAVTPGAPIKLVLRGLNLAELTDVTIVGRDLKPEIASKGKTAVPPNYDLQKGGDTIAEIKFTVPAETPPGTIQLIAVSAAGASSPYELMVASPHDLIEEKEPNDGFKTAQRIATGKTVVGTIHDPRNVDVFELKAEAGQKLIVTVRASQIGSLLDPVLTLYGEAGQIITGSDEFRRSRPEN